MDENDFRRIAEHDFEILFDRVCRGSPELDDDRYDDGDLIKFNAKRVRIRKKPPVTQSQIDSAMAEFLNRGGKVKRIEPQDIKADDELRSMLDRDEEQ